MITNKDLKIGNWITITGVDSLCIVTRVGLESVDTLSHEDVKYGDVQGIELTGYKLNGMGFTFNKTSGIGGQDEWSGYDFWSLRLNGVAIDFRGSKSGGVIILSGYFNCQISTVHHLQNIVRDLTGTDIPTNGFKTLK